MKKKFILLPLAGGLIYVMLTGYSAGPGIGGLGDRTGVTPGTSGCSETGGSCHGTTATATTTVGIQLYDATGSTLITTGYMGGTSYIVKVTGTQTSSSVTLPRFGFQVAAVKTGTATNEGTLSAIAGTHFGTYGGINIVEHSSPLVATAGSGGSGTTYVVKIPWTAPAAGTGSVTVYAILNAVNYNGAADPGDLWNNSTLAIPENAGVAAITGTTTVCAGATVSLADATAGGAWISSHTAVATVGSTGVVTGVSAGTSIISYNAGTAGIATAIVTVLAPPATPPAITGSKIICVGKTTPLGDITTGGGWTSTQTSLATVSGTGVVTGVAVGLDTIKYTVSNTCGTASISHTMSVRAAGTCNLEVEPVANTATNQLKVYPNPNDGTFTINMVSGENEQASIIITNIVGEKINEYNTPTNNELNLKIDAPSGIYFISATTTNGRYISKMILK